MNDTEDFHARIRRLLDEDLDGLDGDVRERLAAARRHAVDQAGRRHRPATWAWALAAGVAAAALALALLLPGTRPDGGAPLEDLDILVSGDDIEFYEELEFYDWLSEQAGEDTLGTLGARLPAV